MLQDNQLILATKTANPQIELVIGRISGQPKGSKVCLQLLFVKRRWGNDGHGRADVGFVQAIHAGLSSFTTAEPAHVEPIDTERFQALLRHGGTTPATDGMSMTGSWVIRERSTNTPVLELFDPALLLRLNTTKYEAVPILTHLQQVARAARGESLQNADDVEASQSTPVERA